MFERLYPVSDKRSPEEIYGILAAARRTEGTRNVVLGAPPFERDWLNRITAVRLRFEQPGGCQPGADEASGDAKRRDA